MSTQGLRHSCRHIPLRRALRDQTASARPIKKTVDPILEAAVKRELCAENLVLAKDEEQSANADTKNCQRAGIHVGRGWQFHRIFCSCTDRTGSYPSFERCSRTRSLRIFPSTVFPCSADLAAFTTAPICFMEFAAVSAIALLMAASISASVAPRGR